MEEIKEDEIKSKHSVNPSVEYASMNHQGDLSNLKWCLHGDVIVRCNNGVSLSDRGFRYGQHLFETVAARGGNYLFAKEHVHRLFKTAGHFGFPISKACEKALCNFLHLAPPGEGLLRLYLTTGEGAVASPIVAPNLFAFWEETLFPSREEIEQGVRLVSLKEPVGTTTWGEKTGNYWDHLRALETARSMGASEGLIFDVEGRVISAAMANLLVWFDGKKGSVSESETDLFLVTPSQARGARDGVVLSWVQGQVPEMIECDITRNDLRKVTAMAITNSRLGVMPVVSLDGRKLPHLELAIQLAHEYRKYSLNPVGKIFLSVSESFTEVPSRAKTRSK